MGIALEALTDSPKKLKELFDEYFYIDLTSKSKLRWKVDRKSGYKHIVTQVKAHSEAGWLGKDGYFSVKLNNVSYKVHKIVYILTYGDYDDSVLEIDHINGISTDNSIENLRLVTRSVNMRNTKKPKNNTSGFTGVHLDKNSSWVASWYINGKRFCKWFSIKKYGFDEAKQMAIDFRNQMIQVLNEHGFGYSARHGT